MSEPTFNPTAFLHNLGRHWVKGVVTLLLVILATLAYTAVSKKQYRSEAKLLVKVGRESAALDPTVTIGAFVGVADTRETEIQAIEELITSQEVLGKVVDRLGPDAILGPVKWYAAQSSWLDDYNLNPLRVYDARAKAIKALSTFIDLTIPRNSKIITLAYEAEDPESARKMVQTLIDVTIDEHLNVNRNDESYGFFEAEAKRLHAQVMELEDKLAKEKDATNISSVVLQRSQLIEQISRYQEQIGTTAARIFALQKELELRAQQLTSLTPTQVVSEISGSSSNPEFEMRVELFKLEVREKELAAKYTDDNSQLRQVREQIKQVQETVGKQTSTRQVTLGLNEQRQKLEIAKLEREAELVEATSRKSQLEIDLLGLKKELMELDHQARRINDLERELSLADSAYRKYQESLEVTRIEKQRRQDRISNISTLQQPTLSSQPVSPKAIVNLLLGSLLGVLAGVGVTAWFALSPTPASSVVGSPAESDVVRLMRRESVSIHT